MPNPVLSGPWSSGDIEAFLKQTVIPIRISAISSKGWPTIVSLWFIFEDGCLKCASKETSRIIQLFENNPRCGFEVSGEEPPYFGVRGQGTVTLDRNLGPKLLPSLIDRYVDQEKTSFRRWLLLGKTEEVGIIINPKRFMSWDYRARMQS